MTIKLEDVSIVPMLGNNVTVSDLNTNTGKVINTTISFKKKYSKNVLKAILLQPHETHVYLFREIHIEDPCIKKTFDNKDWFYILLTLFLVTLLLVIGCYYKNGGEIYGAL